MNVLSNYDIFYKINNSEEIINKIYYTNFSSSFIKRKCTKCIFFHKEAMKILLNKFNRLNDITLYFGILINNKNNYLYNNYFKHFKNLKSLRIYGQYEFDEKNYRYIRNLYNYTRIEFFLRDNKKYINNFKNIKHIHVFSIIIQGEIFSKRICYKNMGLFKENPILKKASKYKNIGFLKYNTNPNWFMLYYQEISRYVRHCSHDDLF